MRFLRRLFCLLFVCFVFSGCVGIPFISTGAEFDGTDGFKGGARVKSTGFEAEYK